MNGATHQGVRPGDGSFVAAYAATNLGDVTPNILGPHCQDTGLPCDFNTSTCNGRNELCVAPGPGKDMFESCEIIASRQAAVAERLYADAIDDGSPVDASGGVDYRHMWVHMPGYVVNDPATGEPVGHLCNASMGQSFAAGTIDGPGMFDFEQGANSSNPLWPFLREVLHKTTPEEKACAEPKDILLPTGNVNVPYPWAEKTLPVQLLQIGDFYILAVPTEMTTMSGRRIRRAVKTTIDSKTGNNKSIVVLAGLSNAYADYTTTFEEYQVQRYEGGSTIYGPHQLQAYTQIANQLAEAITMNTTVPAGSAPIDFSNKVIDSFSKPESETPPKGKKMGDVVVDALNSTYTAGVDAVDVAFIGACPRNNLRLEDTFLEIQVLDGGNWSTFATDGDVETKIHFEKKSTGLLDTDHYRRVSIHWDIPTTATAGTYRAVYFGTWYHAPLIGTGTWEEFTGQSAAFTVASSTSA